VMQTTEIRGSDVHPRASADGFETFEDLDLVGGIRVFADPGGAHGLRDRSAVSGVRLCLCIVLIGAFEACDVGYVCCSGCDVSAGVWASAETARLLRRGPLKSAVPSTPILPAWRLTSLVLSGALH